MSDIIMKCAKVGLVGEPNVGKSTLINKLVGEKVSIVSPKVQTTRTLARGILNLGETQLVFIDTPGLFTPKRQLEKYIVKNAWAGIEDADLLCVLINAKVGITPQMAQLLRRFGDKPLVALINKVDLVRKERLLELASNLHSLANFGRIFMISALKNDGVEDVAKHLASIAPSSPWLYDDETYTDTPQRVMAEEITREQLFLLLNKELPYSLRVETEKWEEMENGSLKLHQAIVVLKPSHKSIVVGASASKIKDVGRRAREGMERLLGRKVHLYLYVKVREEWMASL